MSEIILLPIDRYLEALEELKGEPIQDSILKSLQAIDPAQLSLNVWTEKGRELYEDAIADALSVPKGEDLELEYDIEGIIKAAKEQNVDDELLRDILDDTDDAYIEEEFNDRELAPKITIDSFNNYEFKRYICDLLEVGYQTDSLALISTLIDKIDPTWRLIL